MAMDAREIKRLILEALPDASVDIRDLAGDGDHYAAVVVSESSLDVAAAAKLSPIIGSSQSACAGTAMRPSAL